MDKARFLGIVKRLFDDDRTAIDMDLSNQFNEFLKVGVQNKWIAFEDSSNLSKGLNQKREKLYKTPIQGPDGQIPTKTITRADGTKVTRPLTMVDILEYRKSDKPGGLYGGYKLPQGSVQSFEGMAPREELNKQAPPPDFTTLGKRDVMRQQLQQAQFLAEQEKATKGTESMTAGRYAAIGAGGLLGMVRGVGAPVETLVRKGLGQSRDEILRSQFGSGTSDVDDPFNFGGDRTKFIGQKFTQQIAPTLTGLAAGAALAIPGTAIAGLPGTMAGFIGGGMAGSYAANEAQNALVNAIMGTRTVIGKDGKKQVVGFMDDVAGLQAEEAEKNPFGEFVAEALPNLIAGKPRLPSFVNPWAIKQAVGAGSAGVRASLAAERVAMGPQGAGSLIERGWQAGLAKIPKLAQANQAIASSKVGRSIKGWNAGINQLAKTEGAIGQEFGEEASEFSVDLMQGIYERNQLIRENEARKANGEEPVEVPGYFELIRDAVVGAAFEGEHRLQRGAFQLGGRIGNRMLGLADTASTKLTGRSLNPYISYLDNSATRVDPITGVSTPASGTPATSGAHPMSSAEAADMFRGFTAASGERVIPLGSGQFGVVNAEGRVSRVVEASEVDPTVFTPRGATLSGGTTEAHVAGAGLLLGRSGLRGAEFRPIGAERETVVGTTADGYAVRRTVDGDKIDVRVVSPDVLQPENRKIAEAHMEAGGITPTTATGYKAESTYAEEHTLNRSMLGSGTPAANSYDAAFDTDIAIDSGFTVRGRVVGKAKVNGREVNTHYVVQVPSGNGQVDTVVIPAQNIVLQEGQSLKIHPVMNAGDTNDVLRYSQVTSDDVAHDPAKMNSGKFTGDGIGDGTSPVMLTQEQAETARVGREAISRNSEALAASGKDRTAINRSESQRQGNLRRSVRGTLEASDTEFKRGDYIEHTDYKGDTVAGVVVSNTVNGPLIAPLDNSPAYVVQPSTVTYTQSESGAGVTATPTPAEAAAESIAASMPESTAGAGEEAEPDEVRILKKLEEIGEEGINNVWQKMINYIKTNMTPESTDFDVAAMAEGIGEDPDIVDGIMSLAVSQGMVGQDATGAYDYSKIFATPEVGPEVERVEAVQPETTETSPQEGKRRSTGEVTAREARPAEEQEETSPTMTLKDVRITEDESEAIANFGIQFGDVWQEIQAVKPRNVEELQLALERFLTGSKRREGGVELSAEDVKKAAKLIAELYDRMIFAQANRQLQMAQDFMAGKDESPTSRTRNRGGRITAEFTANDRVVLAQLAQDIDDETLAITDGKRRWSELTGSRTDADIARRIMRKLRMQMMQKYYQDNVPVIGVLDSVEALNDTYHAIFAKGLAAGQPSLQVLIGFADRNVSSAIHEIAHALLENMPEAMQIEAMASLGFTPRTPTASNPSIIPLEAHEKWATSFEAQIMNTGTVNKRGKEVALSSDRTVEQQTQAAEINEIFAGLAPYVRDAYNVAYDNTGPKRSKALVWMLEYAGQENRIFLWDNMPLVIEHEGKEVLAKIPLAPMPRRLFKYEGPGLLPKGSTKTFDVEITEQGHPDFGKTITITNSKIVAIGGATNGFNTRLATTLSYWLSAINSRRENKYKALGKYERYGRETPGYEALSDADKAVLASMGESADGTGTPMSIPILEFRASDPQVKQFLTEMGLDDLTEADLAEIKELGLREDAEYWTKRYRNEDGEWKQRLADSIIDLRGIAIAKKLLTGRGAVAQGYLRLTNGRYHPKFIEFAEAISNVIRTSRFNIRAAEKTDAEGRLSNVNNFDLINVDLTSGMVVMKGPKSNPKTFKVNLKTGDVFVADGVVTSGPQSGQIQWRQIDTPALPAGTQRWISPDVRGTTGEQGAAAVSTMNTLASDMGAATPPQPVNYYYQIARIKVSLDQNVVVSHPPTVFYQQSGGRALRESSGVPLAQASQKKRNKSVGKPIEEISSLRITPDVVEAIRNQKHNEHIMRRIDTSQIYNVRTSDLPNSHAERSAMIISKETQRILAEKDSLLSKLRQREYTEGVPRNQVKPRVYRVFELSSYIDPETNGVALQYETNEAGEFQLDEDGNRIPMLDETGEPIERKKYVERYVVTYKTITPKAGEPVIDLSKEELVRADGTPIEDKMSMTERAYKIAGRLVFYDPIDVQADGSSSQRAVDIAVNHMVSEFNRLALKAMEKYTPIVKWDDARAGMQVWSPMSPIMKVETKTVAGVPVLLPSLSAPKQAYNFDAVGATNRWNATTVTKYAEKGATPEDMIDAVGTNDKHYYMVTKENGKFNYQIAVTNVQTKAITIVEGDSTYDSEKEAERAAQTEYEALRAQAFLLWHQIGAQRIADDILRIAELSQKDEKGLNAEELAEVHNAKVIMRQYDWYRGVSREILKRYGKAGIMMADLIGATSPQTPVDSNWVNAGQILQNMMRPVYERIVRDAGGAKIAYRLPFSSERSITVYGMWRQLSREANKLREQYKVRDANAIPWKSKFVLGKQPNVEAIKAASDAELTAFLGDVASKLETKIPDSLKRRQLESVVQSLIESVYWVRADGGSDPVASYVGWADRTQDWIPVSGTQYESQRGGVVIETPIENEFMKLQRTVVPRNVISGAKFGANTDNVMQALYNSWLDIDEGVAAKARNFSLNLVSLSSGATIDVWAARYIRRAYHDWHQTTPGYKNLSDAEKAFFARIPPIAESGVEGGYTATTKEVEFKNGQLIIKPPKYTIPNPADPRTSGEFGTGQAVMQMATEMINGATDGKLDMLPSDLQAVLWFTEKEVWSNAGWTNSAGAGGSFEYQMMQDIIRFGGFDRWNVQMSGNGVAHLDPMQREVTMQLLNRMVYKGYSGEQIPVGYASFMLSNTAGDQLSLEGRSQLDGMLIGYKGNTPLQPYNPETDLHLVVLNQSEKSLMNAINGVGNASIVVNDADLGAYSGKRIAVGIPSGSDVSIIASVVPERLVENSNGTYTVVLRTPNMLTDSTPVIPRNPVVISTRNVKLQQSSSNEYSVGLMGAKVLTATHINGKSNNALFPARQPLGKHRSMPAVPPFDPYRLYESVARFVQMSGGLDGVISRNIGDINADIEYDPMSNARAGFEWHFAPALSNQRIVGDPQAVRYNQQFSYLINMLQSHFQDAGEHLQMVVQNDPRNVSAGTTGIEAFIGIHGVWTPETELRYADFGVDALGQLSDVQKRNLEKLADYKSGDPNRIRQHEQRWLQVLADFMARPDIQAIVTNDVKLIQAHMSMFDVSVVQREDVHNADVRDIAQLFQDDAARQSISGKLGRAIETLGIIQEGDRVTGTANTQAGQFNDQAVREVEADIQRESTVSLGLYQRKRKVKTTQGDVFHVHSTSYAGARIAGLDSLFNFGMDSFNDNNPEGMQTAWKRITDIAIDEIDNVFSDINGVRINNADGVGIFDGWIEPSVDTAVAIPSTASIDDVLARAAHIGLTFHQSNVFVTQWGMSKNESVGVAPANGDYAVERGVIITLDKPMDFQDVKSMKEAGALGATLSGDGKTLTSFTVKSDYDAGKTDAERVKAFEDGIKELIKFLKTRGIKATPAFQNIRFWNLGAEENGTWGEHREYRAVLGDIEARNPAALVTATNNRISNKFSQRVRNHVESVVRVIHSQPNFVLPDAVSFRQTNMLPSVYNAIAENYESLQDNAVVGPDADRIAVAAYNKLKQALLAQYKWLTTRVELVEGQPYASRMDSSRDILINNRIKLQSDYDISPTHPLAAFMWDGKSRNDVGEPEYLSDASGKPMRYYDMLRAMYTVFADGLYNVSGDEYGADVAFGAYSLMFRDPLAFWAASTEIRARNVAGNYGSAVRKPDGSLLEGELFVDAWKAAPHKAGLMPIEALVSGVEALDNQIDALRDIIQRDFPEYNGTVANAVSVPRTKLWFESKGIKPTLVNAPLAQRKKQITITDKSGVPAGNVVVLDADGTISSDVIQEVIANEPNLDGDIKNQGPIDRLASALVGNIQFMNLPADTKPWEIIRDIIDATNAKYQQSTDFDAKAYDDFRRTLWETLLDRKHEVNYLKPLAQQALKGDVKLTDDGRILMYHTTLAGKHIGETGELLSSDDVQFMTGRNSAGLGGTPNRISYTYSKEYAMHVAKMLANMKISPNMSAPWRNMEKALHARIEEALVDNEPGLQNDIVRREFERWAYREVKTGETYWDLLSELENNGVAAILRIAKRNNPDLTYSIENAQQTGRVRNWMELGEIQDGLQAYNHIFGTPYAMLTVDALDGVIKADTPTKDINVVTYEYAVDPNMLTEHVPSEFEIRTYSTIGIEPTGRIFDRTGDVIKTIDKGDVTEQGLFHGHLLAQRKKNYRSGQVNNLSYINKSTFMEPYTYSVSMDTPGFPSGNLLINWNDLEPIADELASSPGEQNMLSLIAGQPGKRLNKDTEDVQHVFVEGNGTTTIDNSMWFLSPNFHTSNIEYIHRYPQPHAYRVIRGNDVVAIQFVFKNGYGADDWTTSQMVMPISEYLRNASIFDALGDTDWYDMYDEAQGVRGASPFKVKNKGSYTGFELVSLVLQNQGASDDWITRVDNTGRPVYSPTTQRLLNEYRNQLEMVVMEDIYKTSVVIGSKKVVTHNLQNYVTTNIQASPEYNLGFDTPAFNMSPVGDDINDKVAEIALHKHETSEGTKYFVTLIGADTNAMTPQTDTVLPAIVPTATELYEVTQGYYDFIAQAMKRTDIQHEITEYSGDDSLEIIFDGTTVSEASTVIIAPVYQPGNYGSNKFSGNKNRLGELMDTAASLSVANTQIEIPMDGPASLLTTDMVHTAGFDIVDSEGQFLNHALLAMLEMMGPNQGLHSNDTFRFTRRLESSFLDQVENDENLFAIFKGFRSFDFRKQNYLAVTQARLEALWDAHIAPTYPPATPSKETTITQVINRIAEVIQKKTPIDKGTLLTDFMTSAANGTSTTRERQEHEPVIGPNGGILLWHGTLYGKSIGADGQVLTGDDLSQYGVSAPGGGGSSSLISTTYNKRYAFEVARNNWNINFLMQSGDVQYDWFKSVYDMIRRIQAGQQPGQFTVENVNDPRQAYFLETMVTRVHNHVGYFMQDALDKYNQVSPAFPNPQKGSYTGDERDAIINDIVADILLSSTVDELAPKLYWLTTGQTAKLVTTSRPDKNETSLSYIDTPFGSMPIDSKVRRAKVMTNIKKMMATEWDAYYTPSSPAYEINGVEYKVLWDVNQLPFDPTSETLFGYHFQYDIKNCAKALVQLMHPDTAKQLPARKFEDIDEVALCRLMLSLQNAATNQDDKEFEDTLNTIFDMMFIDWRKKHETKVINAVDDWRAVWSDTFAGFADANPNDRNAQSFHRFQEEMHRKMGTAYFWVMGPHNMAAVNPSDVYPVVYEYEVPQDFRAHDFVRSEWEVRTASLRNMVPTGRVFDMFNNDLGPLLGDKNIDEIVTNPNTFVAQRRKKILKKMNPGKWQETLQLRKSNLANGVAKRLNISLTLPTPKATVTALKSRKSRTGVVLSPVLGPPKPPASALRKQTIWDKLVNVYDFFNDIGRMPLSGDMSPLTIQNWLLANPIEDPKLFFAQIGIGLRAAAPNMGFHWKGKTITDGKMMGREAFHDLGNDLRKNPWYQHAQQAGLRLATIDVDRALKALQATNPSATLMDVNELNIQSDVSISNEILQHGLMVGASNRFFAMSKDYVKFTKFANTCQHLVDIGYVPGTPAWEDTVADFAAVYNVMQGDISLGGSGDEEDRLSRLGKRLFFAPRWAISRLMLDPVGLGLLSITPKGRELLRTNRMESWMFGSKLNPKARGAMLRMLMKTWALWAALQAFYNFYYRGFGYGASESTKAGQRLRIGETIFSPPGGLDKTAGLMFAMYDAANAKAYKTPEERATAVKDALVSQLLGNVAPGFTMGAETLFGRDLMGKPSREVYTPLQTYYNTAVRPKMNAVGVDVDMPKISNLVASKIINLATQDFLESYESLYERDRKDAGVRATAYGLASTTGLRARYAPKATAWQRKADQRAPAPGLMNTFIGKDRPFAIDKTVR